MANDLGPSMLDSEPVWLHALVDASHLELLVFFAWLAAAMWQLGYYDALERCAG